MRVQRLLAVVAAAALTGGIVWAQVGRGGSEWLTSGGDAQRTSWVRTDAFISLDTMSKPGFELQWKTTLANPARAGQGIMPGVTANGVTLFVPMSLVTGSSNNVYALDNDTGHTVWHTHFDAMLPAAATAACPGGITGAATRIVSATPAPIPTGRAAAAAGGGARGGGYSGAVGAPGEGVPLPPPRGGGGGRGAAGAAPAAGAPAAAGAAPAGRAGGTPAAPGAGAPAAGAAPNAGAAGAGAVAGGFGARGGAPAAGAPGAGAAGAGAAAGGARGGGGRGGAADAGIPGSGGVGGGGGFGRPSGVVYAIASDGMMHVLGLPSGKDIQKPAAFLPANARWSDPVAVGTMLYTSTSGSCGGAANGVWAIDLSTGDNKAVTSWKTNGGSVVGPVAFTPDGTLLAAIGAGQAGAGGYANSIVALDPKTLQPKDWYTDPKADFTTGPVVFHQNDKDLVVAATKDGRILALDAASLGGANHGTPLASHAGAVASEGLSLWQEATPLPAGAPAGITPIVTSWLLVPSAGAAAGTQAIVSLKVTVDSGKVALDPAWTSRALVAPATPIIVNGVVFALSTGRAAATGAAATPAVLYALDGATGKELWSSGRTVTANVPARSFWVANDQVYVGTLDGTLYTFGFAMERK